MIECDECSGSGHCPWCDGQGELPSGEICGDCEGSGDCSACKGEGRIEEEEPEAGTYQL